MVNQIKISQRDFPQGARGASCVFIFHGTLNFFLFFLDDNILKYQIQKSIFLSWRREKNSPRVVVAAKMMKICDYIRPTLLLENFQEPF